MGGENMEEAGWFVGSFDGVVGKQVFGALGGRISGVLETENGRYPGASAKTPSATEEGGDSRRISTR